MKVYLIFGNTGEWGDYVTWMTRKVFTSLKSAFKYKNQLNSKLSELKVLRNEINRNKYWNLNQNKISLEMTKLDDEFRLDYTGSCYEIEEAELAD